MKIKSYIKHNRESAWKLGVLINGFEDLKDCRIQWVSNGKYKKKWFADPFILEFNESSIVLLVEEYDYSINRGRIAKIIIDRLSWTVIYCKILLDLPTHLSFPCIYRLDGEIFVAPENNESGEFWLYRYDQINEKLNKECFLKEGRLTDAIICPVDNKFFLLTTSEPTPNGYCLEQYESNNFRGPYSNKKVIEFPENIARNAGMPFVNNGQLLRGAQESNYSYGHSLVVQKMEFVDGVFQFEIINRMKSPNMEYPLGMHTLNIYKGLGVIDVKGYRNKLIGKFFKIAHKLLILVHIKKMVKLK